MEFSPQKNNCLPLLKIFLHGNEAKDVFLSRLLRGAPFSLSLVLLLWRFFLVFSGVSFAAPLVCFFLSSSDVPFDVAKRVVLSTTPIKFVRSSKPLILNGIQLYTLFSNIPKVFLLDSFCAAFCCFASCK